MRQGMKTALPLALTLGLATVCAAQTAQGDASSHPASGHPAVRNALVKPHTAHHVIYTNNRYGFRFYLPVSWKGYSIIQKEWGDSSESEINPEEHGPLILIRHPLCREENPREDIPIMIFTHRQWREVDRGDFSVSPAPVLPNEIGRNKRYVFALPPRFDYDFLDGWQEVVKILQGEPLHAYSVAKARSSHPLQTGAH